MRRISPRSDDLEFYEWAAGEWRHERPEETEPDEDLLEFLGGIDEVNDESQDEDFSDFLANATSTIADAAARRRPSRPRRKRKHE
jgi:hypothetical protein